MATVHFPNDLRRLTGGLERLEVDAPRVQQLFSELARRFPGLAPELEKTAVAIDGDIYNDAPYHKLTSASEIHLVPRITGG